MAAVAYWKFLHADSIVCERYDLERVVMESGGIVIWGAGRWGRVAYAYYCDSNTIAGFIDSDRRIWGNTILGLPVLSPDVLEQQKYHVVIAMKDNVEVVKKILLRKYGIEQAVVFSVKEVFEDIYEESEYPNKGDEIIVTFCGGLGNQMFQYALYKIYEKQGKKVCADLSKYMVAKSLDHHDIPSFLYAFQHATIQKYSPAVKKYFCDCKQIFKEPIRPKIVFDNTVLGIENGIVEGFFQSYRYPFLVKEELHKDFLFDCNGDSYLEKLAEQFQSGSTVSIHFRRGDYLADNVHNIFGDACDTNYYQKAIELIRGKLKDPRFVFFSNDIAWVKENYVYEDAIYVASSMFEKYEDWYDMYLMSCCKHNIIANSTFSWWAAWLNPNPDKIVIAPAQWMRHGELQDICPPEWIRI